MIRTAALFMHGKEADSLGGPTVRVPGTARALRAMGIDATVHSFPNAAIETANLVHGFNVWDPQSSLNLARRARELGKPYVFSSIFLDLSREALWNKAIPRLLTETEDVDALDDALEALTEKVLAGLTSGKLSSEPTPGYHAIVREIISLADHVILLSEHERNLLRTIGARLDSATIVHNPVDPDVFGNADPDIFARTYGFKDYILCVARVEPRKNQALMLHALRDLNLPIVLMGHALDKAYEQIVQRYAGDNVHLLGRVPHDSGLVASAMTGARVVVLPSWSEGAPLAALEAGATGASMVLSNRSSEQEYFGSHARYCDPGDVKSLRSQILEAYESPFDATRRQEVKDHVKSFNWERYAAETAAVYRRTLAAVTTGQDGPKAGITTVAAATAERPTILYDLTTSANRSGRWTGIVRFESLLALALCNRPDVDIEYVVWCDSIQGFIRIPSSSLGDILRDETLREYADYAAKRRLTPRKIRPGAYLVVGGSDWMQSRNYPSGVVTFAHANNLILTTIIHDIIPVKFPHWFESEYVPVFDENLKTILIASEKILAVSENTRQDINAFALTHNIFTPPIGLIREGDEISPEAMKGDSQPAPMVANLLRDHDFVIAVGAIHTRKNYTLLYNVWNRLIETMGARTPKLVIVGGVAWNGDDLARAFREDPQVSRFAHVLDNIDDQTLDWLYHNCIFSVYPSLYEGWGLPVGESLARGKICIAARTSSVPEIAPGETDLIDPLDFPAWFTRIRLYASSRSARQVREREIREHYRQTPWTRTANDVADALQTPPQTSPFWNVFPPGLPLKAHAGAVSQGLTRAGWHQLEDWGGWSSQLSAHATVRLSKAITGNGLLIIRAQALASYPNNLNCDVLVNDVQVGSLVFFSEGIRLFSLPVPADVLAGRQHIDIEFRNDRLITISQYNSTLQDERRIGIGLLDLTIAEENFRENISTYGEIGDLTAGYISLGEKIDLRWDPRAANIVPGKITVDANWGVYLNANTMAIALQLFDPISSDLIIRLRYRAVAIPEDPVRLIAITERDVVLGALAATSDDIQEAMLRVPADLARKQAPLLIEFVGTKARIPSELGLGQLATNFVFGLFSLSVTTEEGGVAGNPNRAVNGVPNILA